MEFLWTQNARRPPAAVKAAYAQQYQIISTRFDGALIALGFLILFMVHDLI